MVQLIFFVHVLDVRMTVSHLLDCGCAEQQMSTDVPQQTLHPEASPDITDTKRGGHRQIETPEGFGIGHRVLRVVGRESERIESDRWLGAIESDATDGQRMRQAILRRVKES